MANDTIPDRSIPLEIERKFLIRRPDERWLSTRPGHRVRRVTQTYLVTDDEATQRRVRRCEENGRITFLLTEKTDILGGDGLVRQEAEREIGEREYEEFLRRRDEGAEPLSKVRHVIPCGRHNLEIDIYPFDAERAILEVELGDADEDIILPSWVDVICEVTGIPAYGNVSLARTQSMDLTQVAKAGKTQ